MANAGRDQNFVPTIIAISTADSTTILPIYANPANHGIKVSDATSGSFTGNRALRDDNFVTTLTALSSAGDGVIVALYVTTNHQLLISS